MFVSTLLMACTQATDSGSDSADTWNPEINPSDFTVDVDHVLLPFPVGATWTYQTVTSEGTEVVAVEVLSDIREVMGVDVRVVRDTATVDGVVIEDTWDWYAQHADGSVWYFGEDTTAYEPDGTSSKGGSWEAGVDGAYPGIVMEAEPVVGDSYYQEYLKGEAEDEAEVLALNEHVEVPYGSFDGCLATADTTALDPEVLEHKFYCEGVGLVLTTEADVSEELTAFEPGS